MTDTPRTHRVEFTYEGALKAAGYTVLASQHFGMYQGEWAAKVERGDERGWIRGSYGSCTGCDAMQGEFGYEFGEFSETGDGYLLSDEEFERFRDFGESYSPAMSDDEILDRYRRDGLDGYGGDEAEAIAFVESNRWDRT